MRTEDRIACLEVQLRQAFLPSGEPEEQLTELITMTRRLLKRIQDMDEMLQEAYQRERDEREKRWHCEKAAEELLTDLETERRLHMGDHELIDAMTGIKGSYMWNLSQLRAYGLDRRKKLDAPPDPL